MYCNRTRTELNRREKSVTVKWRKRRNEAEFSYTLQRVASILTCPQDDATSADRTSPSSRPRMLHDAMWVTFTETRRRTDAHPRKPTTNQKVAGSSFVERTCNPSDRGLREATPDNTLS
jgi:hypothetical protein